MFPAVIRESRKFAFRKRSTFAMLRSGQARICLLVIFLVARSWGAPQAVSSSTELTQKLVSGRAARTIPHRFAVVPSGISLSSNQTQHFGVTDSQGNAVAVRWSVSGLHCAGFTCGSIDADGNYTPPVSVSQTLEIMLEGVVVSDPNYSVMTHVQIKPATAVNASLASNSGIQISAAPQIPPAPTVEKMPVAQSPSLPQHQAVAPPPVVANNVANSVVRQQVQQPVTSVVAAAPSVDARALAARPSSLQVPTAVAATPVVSTAHNTDRQQLAPLPNAVAAAPVLNEPAGKNRKHHSDDGTIMLDVPSTLSNLTVAKKQEAAGQSATNIPSGTVNSAKVSSNGNAPVAAASHATATTADLHPIPNPAGAASVRPATPVSTAPQPIVQSSQVAGISTTAKSKSESHSQPPAIVTSSPQTASVQTASLEASSLQASSRQPKPQSPAIISAPVNSAPTNSTAMNSAPVTTPIAPKMVASISPSTGTSPAISATPAISRNSLTTFNSQAPLAGISVGTTGATSSAAPNSIAPNSTSTTGTQVTYRDGQLKIDAENITLAEVLQLVGKKMGAVIDVPPGSGLERIVEHVGPGRPNDVLTQLLNGSHFNFIIVNSAIHPNEPAEVLLSMEGKDVGTAPVMPAAPAPTTSSFLYTPPTNDPTLHPLPLPPQYDPSLAAPANRDSLTPDALSELMRAKAKELRERAMQQAGVSPDTSQPPPPPPTPQAPPPEPPQQ